MKKLIFVFMAMAMMFGSCSDSDNTPEESLDHVIIGNWVYSSLWDTYTVVTFDCEGLFEMTKINLGGETVTKEEVFGTYEILDDKRIKITYMSDTSDETKETIAIYQGPRNSSTDVIGLFNMPLFENYPIVLSRKPF